MIPKVPQRLSLVTQSVDLLRKAMAAGTWGTLLPGEITLCNELQVSRVTLRTALEQLEREGWITSGRGRRRQIDRSKVVAAKTFSNTMVILLSPIPLQNMSASVILRLVALRERLGASGFGLEIVTNLACFSRRPAKALEALHQDMRPACYILHLSTGAMQRWFSDRKISCMITGSCHPGVNLPSIDVDYAAVCHHAVGRLASAGRNRLALLMPRSDHAGNLESGQGFLAAGAQLAEKQVQTAVAYHESTVESVCRTIDRLIGGAPPVNGLLVAKPAHVITAICHLLRRRVRIPEDISVISRDDDPALDNLVPLVGRYQTDPEKFARQLARIAIHTISNGARPHPTQRVMPSFTPGRTLR